jgi:hypothetical protein
MEDQYGENWTMAVKPEDIQRSSRRIFKEMIRAQVDYERVGQYFLDAKIMDNLIIAASNELEINTMLFNATTFFQLYNPNYPNLGSEISHLQALCYIYNVILEKLKGVKYYNNIGILADVAALLSTVRNHLQ